MTRDEAIDTITAGEWILLRQMEMETGQRVRYKYPTRKFRRSVKDRLIKTKTEKLVEVAQTFLENA